MRLIKLFLYALTIALVAACVVYWFNIRSSDAEGRRKITAIFAAANSETDLNFKLSDGIFAKVDKQGSDWVVWSISTYKNAAPPFCFVCGMNKPSSEHYIQFPHLKDGYYYGTQPAGNGAKPFEILNASTYQWESATEDELKAKGMIDDPQFAITPESLGENYDEIHMQKESCFTMMIAFMILYAIALPTYFVLRARERKKRKTT